MSYRDDLEAAQARADAESERADRLQDELDALKAPKPPAPPRKEPRPRRKRASTDEYSDHDRRVNKWILLVFLLSLAVAAVLTVLSPPD